MTVRKYYFINANVDDILIAYDQGKIDEQAILQRINGIDNNLQFKMTTEVNNTINYLDILIRRNITIELYRKLTETGTAIHFKSNHPHEHKIAAFLYY